MHEQAAAGYGGRKEELDFRLREIEQAAVEWEHPAQRGRRQQSETDGGGRAAAQRVKHRRGRRATPSNAASAPSHARKDAEVEIGGSDDGADQVARFAQPAKAHAHAVSCTARN